MNGEFKLIKPKYQPPLDADFRPAVLANYAYQGEVTASHNITKAAMMLAQSDGALHLRTLHTLNDLSSDKSNTVIFALPLEILKAFGTYSKGKHAQASSPRAPRS